jgi:polyferredoxin
LEVGMNRLRPYNAPGMLIVVSLFGLWWSWILLFTPLGGVLLALVIGLYGVGAIWWLRRSLRPSARAWPDALIVWAIDLPWLALAAIAFPRTPGDDYARLAETVVATPATILGVACATVTIWLLVRARRPASPQV